VELTVALELPQTGSRPRVDRRNGVLVGSRCDECGANSWPARAVCHRCGAPVMREHSFSARGTLLTYTTVWVPRPGLEPPYTIGQVKLEDGPLVFGHIRGLADGTPVPAAVQLALADELPAVPPFWFEPEEAL